MATEIRRSLTDEFKQEAGSLLALSRTPICAQRMAQMNLAYWPVDVPSAKLWRWENIQGNRAQTSGVPAGNRREGRLLRHWGADCWKSWSIARIAGSVAKSGWTNLRLPRSAIGQCRITRRPADMLRPKVG